MLVIKPSQMNARTKALVITIITAAASLNIPEVRNIASPLLVGHPYLTALFGLVMTLIGVLQNPTVRNLIKPPDSSEIEPKTDPVDLGGSTPTITKSVVLAVALGVGSFSLMGCAHKAVNAPLPVGAVDAADANAYKVLKPAHDFAAHLTASVQSGKIHPTDSQKMALESLNKAINVADTALIQYHDAGGGDAAAIGAATTAVSLALTTAMNSFLQVSKQDVSLIVSILTLMLPLLTSFLTRFGVVPQDFTGLINNLAAAIPQLVAKLTSDEPLTDKEYETLNTLQVAISNIDTGLLTDEQKAQMEELTAALQDAITAYTAAQKLEDVATLTTLPEQL